MYAPADEAVYRKGAARQGVEILSIGQTAGQATGLSLMAVPEAPNLSEEDRRQAAQRFKTIEPLLKPDSFRQIWLENLNRRTKVIEALSKQYRTPVRTISRWVAAWRSGGLPALVRKDRSDKGRPKVLNAAGLDFIISAAFPKHGQRGELSVRDILRQYNDEREWRAKASGRRLTATETARYERYVMDGCLRTTAQLPEASYSTFRNWFLKIPEIARVMARDGDEAYHNTQEILSFRNLTDIRPLDYVVMDHRLLDIFCLIPTRAGWSLARPWLTAAIDMRTRKWLAWAIVETPSSDSIATVLKRSFLAYGLPVSVYWDNGKDFRCEWLEGRSARVESRRVGELETVFRGVLDTLGIRVHHAIVKRARSKIIEPNFGRTADFDRTLPWWCGHKPTARPSERFDKLLAQHDRWLASDSVDPAFPTIEEVAQFYGEFLQELNERPMQGAEGMTKITPAGRGWMCPNEAWERLIPAVERRTVPEDVIHLCFAKRRELAVRNGEIRTTFGGKLRHYRIGNNPLRLMALNGYQVQLAYDPLDLETAAVYYENRFVGLVDCIELRGMGEDSFVEDEKLRRVSRREAKSFIERVHKSVYVADHAERHKRRAIVPRVEPVRPTGDVSLPESVLEAASALGDRASVIHVAVEATFVPEQITGDDEFNFFEQPRRAEL